MTLMNNCRCVDVELYKLNEKENATCAFRVSPWTVESGLTQARWTSETCGATELARWTWTAAIDIYQMKTATIQM